MEEKEHIRLLGETPDHVQHTVAPTVTKSGIAGWLSRLMIYFKVMYPLGERLGVAAIMFCESYFITSLNHHVSNFSLGLEELVGAFTVFLFLMWLRVADDLKDYEHDCRLFADRPLPLGQVTRRDLHILVGVIIPVAILLNWLFMPNFIMCLILFTYGSLMAVWFFQKHKIQPSLPMALVTHNPVQFLINAYIISLAIIKYHLPVFDWINFLTLFTLYFPALIWEVARKIRAPRDETEYTTYSKLFGYKKATTFVEILTLVDICTNFALVAGVFWPSIIVLALMAAQMTRTFEDYKKDPTRYKIVDRVVHYTFCQETTMLLTIGIALLRGLA